MTSIPQEKDRRTAKIVLCTTPIRPVPTDYPPAACTTLTEELIELGYSPFFYDIDALRPKVEEVVEFLQREQPDLFLISAVVSTAYRYVKELTHAVSRVSPKTQIILGGNLAASAEILLRKCPIQVCVIGEGERILGNLMEHWEKFGQFRPTPELAKIKGISFIDSQGQFSFTGYEAALPSERLRHPNYLLLKKYSKIDNFIRSWHDVAHFRKDSRSHQPHRKDQKVAMIMTAKGCVARCTFCHRWDKGYRTHAVGSIIQQIKHLKENFNVGFFEFGDENSLSDPRQVLELIEAIRPLDVLFKIGGIRVGTIAKRPELIRELQEVGCVSMIFGMETGSEKMLNVMEKGTGLRQNIEIVRRLVDEKMYTVVQLVVGMPGENEATIAETIEFVKIATENMDDVPYERLSVNYFQALPGTPGYEFARAHGLIGKTMEDEEAYLLKISDVDACAWEHYQNVTECSVDRVRLWGQRIVREATIHYFKRRGWKPINETEEISRGRVTDYVRGGYFRILKPTRGSSARYWKYYSLFKWFIHPAILFRSRVFCYGTLRAILLTLHLIAEEDRSAYVVPDKSLRKVVQHPNPAQIPLSEANMLPLRMGR